ncbi:MAG: four helix bundle protein [Polyangiaceae bacterium]
MRITLRQQLLDHVTEIITLVRPLTERIARHDRDLVNQMRRALNSVALNLAEGLGHEGGNTRVRFQSARGSLYEALAALRVAEAWGYVSASEVARIVPRIDSLSARLHGFAKR